MKSAIPASALTVLLSPVQVLSTQKLHALSVVTNHEETRAKKETIQVENERRLAWEKKSLRLKRRLKAKLDLKSKMEHNDWHLTTTEEECVPFEYLEGERIIKKHEGDVDVGILRGCDNPYHYCIEDASSSLGGVCARAISTADKKVKHPSMPTIEEESEFDTLIGDNEEVMNIDHTKSGNKLKFVKVADKLKANRILKEGKEAAYKSSNNMIGKECHLGKNPGFVDVGILNGCKQSIHVCIEDSSSSLGGTCVDVGSEVDGNVVSSRSLSVTRNEQVDVTVCTYTNGTSGERCSGLRACYGLSESFISTNIGCGSCNAYGSCSGLGGEFKYFVSPYIVPAAPSDSACITFFP